MNNYVSWLAVKIFVMQNLFAKIKRQNFKASKFDKKETTASTKRNASTKEKIPPAETSDNVTTDRQASKENVTKSESDGALQQEVVYHDRVVAVIIHRTDRIKNKIYISHPTVKIHVVNGSTGEYLKKSHVQRPGAYNLENVNLDHILPLMTKPFKSSDTVWIPTWEELLLVNESFNYFVKPENQTLLIFEILDFMSMESMKLHNAGLSDANTLDGSSGWYRIAWAFLKIVSTTGEVNCGKQVRLQLYRAPRKARMKDGSQCEVFYWYKELPKIKYSGSLYVTVKGTTPPNNVPKVSRSMFAVQSEGPSTDGAATEIDKDEKIEEKLEDIYLWSRLPGQPCKVPNKQISSLVAGKFGCFTVQFSTNGRLVACAGCDSQRKYPIFIYSVPDGQIKAICLGHVNLVYEMKFNLNSTLLLSASADCTAKIWDTNTFTCIQTFPHTTFVYCAKFHPANENLIVTGCFDKKIRIWQMGDALDGRIVQELESHMGYVNSFCFSIDGLTMFSADGSGYIRLWDTPGHSPGHWALRKELKEDELLGKPINNVILHPDQKRLIVHSRDGVIRMLELRAYALRQRFTGFENSQFHIRSSLSPCGTFLFAGSENGKVIVWHANTAKKVSEYNKLRISGDYPVSSVAYHPLDHIVAFAVFGEAQLVFLYKYDSSVSDLYEDDALKKDSASDKPTFDPNFSVAKLLEEHKILSQLNTISFKPKSVQQQPQILLPNKPDSEDNSMGMEPIDIAAIRKSHAIHNSAMSKKTVSFKSPSSSPEIPQKHKRAVSQEIKIIAPKPLLVPSIDEEGRQPSLLEKTFSDEEEEPESQINVDDTPQIEQYSDAVVEEMPKEQFRDGGTAYIQTTNDTVLFTVQAKHTYEAQNQDEISFNSHDVINVVNNDDPNWWVGFVIEGQVGYFPTNFVEQPNQSTTNVVDETEVTEI